MYVLILLNIIKAIFKIDMTKVKKDFIEKNGKKCIYFVISYFIIIHTFSISVYIMKCTFIAQNNWECLEEDK